MGKNNPKPQRKAVKAVVARNADKPRGKNDKPLVKPSDNMKTPKAKSDYSKVWSNDKSWKQTFAALDKKQPGGPKKSGPVASKVRSNKGK